MSNDRRPLRGLRVLVTENDAVLALAMAETVQEFGGVVLGPAGAAAEALELVARARPEAALLDLWLRDGKAVSVARSLHDRRVPFGVVSGSDGATLDDPALHGAPRLAKPFGEDGLRRLLLDLARRADPSSAGSTAIA
jgi:response regulator of citrate/malate metabolism